MPERNQPANKATPDCIFQWKEELFSYWRRLPAEHQASVTLMLVKEALSGESKVWLQEGLSGALAQAAAAAAPTPQPDAAPAANTLSANNPFVFTEREQQIDRLTHERLLAFLRTPDVQVHRVEVSTNNYGEFLFVTATHPVSGKQRFDSAITFFGLGYHEPRDRWLHKEWFFFETQLGPATTRRIIPLNTVERQIEERQGIIRRHVRAHHQSHQGKVFDELADLSDDDSALADLEDMDDWETYFGKEDETKDD